METKLERWERAVRERPQVAETCGPPNWLVCEDWKKKADGTPAEPFETAAERVKRRYFPEMSQENVPPTFVPPECPTGEIKHCSCGNPLPEKGKECYRCKKRRQRQEAQ